MSHRITAGSGYIVLIATLGIFAAPPALMIHEAVVVASSLILREGVPLIGYGLRPVRTRRSDN